MPLGFLRGMLGVFCIAFAHLFGRSVIRLGRGLDRKSRTLAEALRTLAAGFAVGWRVGFDGLTITVLVLALVFCAAGMYLERRPKRREELEKEMFPRE